MYKNNMRHALVTRLIGLSMLLLLAYICFFRLGTYRLENWDEAWYADMMRNVLRTGNLAVMYWNKFPLLDKPPLYIWLGSLTSFVFGLNEFAFRLPSALSGFLTVILVTKYAARRWGLLAAIMAFGTLALNNVFMWRTRTANLDALVTFLITLVFLFAISTAKRKYLVLGFLFALIFLAKASLVVMPLAIFLASELIYEYRYVIKHIPHYVIMFLIPLIICGLWLYAGNAQLGGRFADYYLFHSDQNVARITLSNFKTDYILFAYYTLQRRFMYPFILGIILLLWNIKKKESFLLIAFSTALLFLLSFTERKNNWYLMPAMPFWSLVIGYGISETIRFFKKNIRLQSAIIAGVLCVSGYIFFKTFTVNIQSLIYTSGTGDQAAAALFIQKASHADDTVIRTDQLYPTTIYYSGLKTYAFDPNADLSNIGIGSSGLTAFLSAQKPLWISGTASDIDNLKKTYLSTYDAPLVFTQGQEQVLQLKYR